MFYFSKRNYYFIFGEGSRINQVICAILINMPVFIYGAAVGWMSPMMLLLQSDNSPRDVPLTDNEVSWMASIAYLMCVASGIIMGISVDKIGRKNSIYIMSAAGLGCWVIKIVSLNTWTFIIARLLVGVMMGAAFVTCPLYTNEISEDVIRGMLGSMVILFQTVGNLFLYIIGDYLDYYTILYICVSLPVIQMVLFTMMPESPSYLVKRGQFEKATQALAWLRCRREDDVVVLNELNQLKNLQARDDECKKFILKVILTEKILFRAFKIALIVTLAREVCGAITVQNYAGEIFSEASQGTGLVLTPNQQAMMLGVVQVLGSSATVAFVEKLGRKGLLFITSLISGLSMCLLASWFLARNFEVFLPSWLPIVTLCLCIFCDSFGLQPVSVVLNSELFSFKYRATVTSATTATASVLDFIQLLFFKPVMNSIGPHVAFYFFGGICLLMAVYTIIVIPETKAKSLEEIYGCLMTRKERLQEQKKKERIQIDVLN